MGYGGDRLGEYFSVRVSNIDKSMPRSIQAVIKAKGGHTKN